MGSPLCLTSVLLVCVAFLTSSVTAQFLTPPSPSSFISTTGFLNLPVRYKEVPYGICELVPGVRSFSGYVDISPTQHAHFWFFERRPTEGNRSQAEDPTTPLSVWISGGPGNSGMSELFQEHGPCTLYGGGNPSLKHAPAGAHQSGKRFALTVNPTSWNNYSNMLYLDQPITVGYSYAEPLVNAYIDHNTCDIVEVNGTQCPSYAKRHDHCPQYANGICGTFSFPDATHTANSTLSAAPGYYQALQGFAGAFPQYVKGGFNLASESYGGHYIPVFTRYILEQNAQSKQVLAAKNATVLPINSILVGNGWYSPALGYQGYYNFTVSPGNTYDIHFPQKALDQGVAQRMYEALYGTGNCLDRLAECNDPSNEDDNVCVIADHFCAENVEHSYNRELHRDGYDSREKAPSPFPYYNYFEYLNSEHVLEALGAFQNYTDLSKLVANAFYHTGDDGKELGILEAMQHFLDEGISVTLYHGDADYNWYGGEMASAAVGGEAWVNAGYSDLITSDGIVHGQVKQQGKLSFVRVYDAGHGVGFYQPLLQQTMFQRTITGVDLATGKTKVGSGYVSSGPKQSTYRQGNATVQYHVLPGNAIYNRTTNAPNP